VNSRDFRNILGRPFVKRFAVSYRTVVCPVLSVLSCLKLSVMSWPNGWMDQDATWHRGRPRPWPYCFRWEPSSPPQKRWQSWIRMSPGMDISLGPDNIVLDGDPASSKKGQSPQFWPMSVVAKRLDGSRCHLVRKYVSAQTTLYTTNPVIFIAILPTL